MGERKKAFESANFHFPRVLKFKVDNAAAKRDIIVINKIDFAAKNLTSNAGLFLLLKTFT
jgi:hypothetical protein